MSTEHLHPQSAVSTVKLNFDLSTLKSDMSKMHQCCKLNESLSSTIQDIVLTILANMHRHSIGKKHNASGHITCTTAQKNYQ